MIESKLTPRPYRKVKEPIKIENCRLMWRNFAGEKRMYNENGKRMFSIPLDEDLALELYNAGWPVKDNIKRINNGEADELLYHITVTVKFDGRVPPKLFMITKSKNRRTPLDEDTAGLLDYAEFDNVDVIIRPFNWDINGQQGVSPYLKTGFFVLHEDDLEKKYAHIPLETSDERLAIEAADDVIDVEGADDVIDVEGEWVDDVQDAFNYGAKALPRGTS